MVKAKKHTYAYLAAVTFILIALELKGAGRPSSLSLSSSRPSSSIPPAPPLPNTLSRASSTSSLSSSRSSSPFRSLSSSLEDLSGKKTPPPVKPKPEKSPEKPSVTFAVTPKGSPILPRRNSRGSSSKQTKKDSSSSSTASSSSRPVSPGIEETKNNLFKEQLKDALKSTRLENFTKEIITHPDFNENMKEWFRKNHTNTKEININHGYITINIDNQSLRLSELTFKNGKWISKHEIIKEILKQTLSDNLPRVKEFDSQFDRTPSAQDEYKKQIENTQGYSQEMINWLTNSDNKLQIIWPSLDEMENNNPRAQIQIKIYKNNLKNEFNLVSLKEIGFHKDKWYDLRTEDGKRQFEEDRAKDINKIQNPEPKQNQVKGQKSVSDDLNNQNDTESLPSTPPATPPMRRKSLSNLPSSEKPRILKRSKSELSLRQEVDQQSEQIDNSRNSTMGRRNRAKPSNQIPNELLEKLKTRRSIISEYLSKIGDIPDRIEKPQKASDFISNSIIDLKNLKEQLLTNQIQENAAINALRQIFKPITTSHIETIIDDAAASSSPTSKNAKSLMYAYALNEVASILGKLSKISIDAFDSNTCASNKTKLKKSLKSIKSKMEDSEMREKIENLLNTKLQEKVIDAFKTTGKTIWKYKGKTIIIAIVLGIVLGTILGNQ